MDNHYTDLKSIFIALNNKKEISVVIDKNKLKEFINLRNGGEYLNSSILKITIKKESNNYNLKGVNKYLDLEIYGNEVTDSNTLPDPLYQSLTEEEKILYKKYFRI